MRSLLRGIASLVAAVSIALVLIAPASGATDLFASLDPGFDVGTDAWNPSGGAFSIATPPLVHNGKAGRIVASTGTVSVRSKYWLTPSIPSTSHTLTLWIFDNDPAVTLTVTLEFLGDGENRVGPPSETSVGNDSPAWRLVTIGPITSLPGTQSVRVTVRGSASNTATFYVDDISLSRADPPPTTVPTQTATTSPATSTPTSAPTQLASTPTTAPTSVATPSLVPTAIAIATPAPVFPTLVNGNFEALAPLDGWDNVGGTLSTVSPGLDGTGRAALLTSASDSTKYAFETVIAEPGAWYAARASLRPSGDASAAWLRIAWYASTDGSGSQLAVADSNLVTTRDITGTANIAASQAPSTARSARVRVMLRPASNSAAYVVADDIVFTPTSAPVAAPTPTPRIVPTPSTRPPDSAAPAQPPTNASGSSSGAATAQRTSTARPSSNDANLTTLRVGTPAPRAAVNGPLLRITELMPDPSEPGADQDFEWIELANLGSSSASLEGLWLADNAGAIELPPLTLSAGKVLVIAGAQAKVPDTESWSPPGGFSNGLGNAGDRLVLYTKDGGILDALSYGSDTTYDKPALPAPGAGKSLMRRFADDGSFASAEVSTTPTPGLLDTIATSTTTAIEARASATPSATTSSSLAYVALGGLGVAALGAAAAQRYRTARALKTSSTDKPSS
ncbi:MAG: hypothetical protein DWI48_05465 [Chloroflexi bacterium]|nr:MAG: hypothetical protein DWI48_05465 [Chloroflexota bacterium]